MNALSSDFNFINIAGLGGSGESHWQTLWAKMNPEIINVRQREWDHPKQEDWTDTLIETIEDFGDKPIVLIAHSLAVVTVLFAAETGKLSNVKGAFLVAPADSERKDFPKTATNFSPIPRSPLPFPSIIVASENDPWCSIEKARKLANATGAKFVNVGAKGHLTSEAGIGAWEIGHQLLEDFVSIL